MRVRFAIPGALVVLLALGPWLAGAPALGQSGDKAAEKADKKAALAKPPPLPKRVPFSAEAQGRAQIPDIPEARFFADSAADFARALPRAAGPWLALSGGGEDGAFGAGLMVGWSQAGARPDFALVTGASTGALMAPFVFLGARYDATLRANFTSITAADVFEAGGKGESLFDTWPLKDMIAKQVTAELLTEIAAAHAAGRRLFVVTTNLDAGRPVVWNMGAIAARADAAALDLFRAVLLASSSVPGVFPPVLIEAAAGGETFQEMHADGTINAPFYVAPAAVLSGEANVTLPARALYVLVNTRLTPEFHVVPRETAAVLGRSISLALKAGLRLELARTKAAATRIGLPLQAAAVESEFDPPRKGAFDPDYMAALFARGEKQGLTGAPFCGEPPCRPPAQALIPAPQAQ